MYADLTMADRIRAALRLQELYGQSLTQDSEIAGLLGRLDANVEATQKAMVDTGIVAVCADCAVTDQGTCCGARTGYKNDTILLLINLLLGRSLPLAPADALRCHFLTRHGCALRARHVICVNFVCQRLKDAIPHGVLCGVQETAGREMDVLFVLEERIKKKIGTVEKGPDLAIS